MHDLQPHPSFILSNTMKPYFVSQLPPGIPSNPTSGVSTLAAFPDSKSSFKCARLCSSISMTLIVIIDQLTIHATSWPDARIPFSCSSAPLIISMIISSKSSTCTTPSSMPSFVFSAVCKMMAHFCSLRIGCISSSSVCVWVWLISSPPCVCVVPPILIPPGTSSLRIEEDTALPKAAVEEEDGAPPSAFAEDKVVLSFFL
mmetsp:Transcript_15808/g.39113  ORF Transcript_15808/g.39113 Transcript_15808/m.39113 type:complete len:201 (+) Transcript_15808:999-1601(+)